MKKVFIDANILIDYLSTRSQEEDRNLAIAVIHYCHTRLGKAYISIHSFMVLFHILDFQFVNKAVLKQKLEQLYYLFNVVPITNQDIEFAFKSAFSDFEDAVQTGCASGIGVDIIVTKNVEDYYSAKMLVIPPEQFFDFI